MDEVAFAIHIKPLLEAVKELNERFAHMSMMMETKFEAVHRMEVKLHANDRVMETLLERSTPRSNCAFCAYEDNKDMHVTSRCCRYPDPVSRAIQASTRQLCEKCLQPKHLEECGISTEQATAAVGRCGDWATNHRCPPLPAESCSVDVARCRSMPPTLAHHHPHSPTIANNRPPSPTIARQSTPLQLLLPSTHTQQLHPRQATSLQANATIRYLI
ncbi:hypothetical protein ANCDUO_12394 [Ancylostoma duodenale]|uniref:Uncharacterized protein n=1 Tax=Ancylostoma duodenale TaxID=51022 RepID=A0A0C2G904_9BILA|nr:hypothetical protein ANCDUO_12394 [Ancylostoma duodenale]